MTLFEKLLILRPNLTHEDFGLGSVEAVIVLKGVKNGEEFSSYIESWDHPTETQPTQEEIDSL
jgi:hypothetical protein